MREESASGHSIDRPAAYEVHDLNTVALGQDRLGPLSTSRDVFVQLNRYARRREREALDEIFKTRSVRQLLDFSVDMNAQSFFREVRTVSAG